MNMFGFLSDEAGHARWVATMTAEQLPSSLTDCFNSMIGKAAEMFRVEVTFERKPK